MPTIDGFNPPPAPGSSTRVAPLPGKPFTPAANSPALDGLSPSVVDAIRAGITDEMIHALVGCLSPTPRYVDPIRRELVATCAWFPATNKPDTQKRLIRRIQTAAIYEGYPVCTSNKGLYLGTTKADVIASAEREARLKEGAAEKEALYRRLARSMP